MPWEDAVDSVRRSVESVEVPTSRTAALFGLVRWSVLAGLIVAALVVPAAAFAGVTMSRLTQEIIELPADLADDPAAQTTRVLSSDGKKMAYFYRENRQDVPLAKISPTMRQAIQLLRACVAVAEG